MLKIVGSIRRKVEAYRAVQEKKRHHEHWAKLIHCSLADRDHETEPHKTLAAVTDDEVIIEYMDGRMIGQRHVTPLIIDSTNWGVVSNSKDRHSTNTDCSNGPVDSRAHAGVGPCSSDCG